MIFNELIASGGGNAELVVELPTDVTVLSAKRVTLTLTHEPIAVLFSKPSYAGGFMKPSDGNIRAMTSMTQSPTVTWSYSSNNKLTLQADSNIFSTSMSTSNFKCMYIE
nr:hypothetical protein [Clostridia bacterium]